MNMYKITTIIALTGILTACGGEPAPSTDTPKTDAESVPMSAEPAEPTGVMNAEPVDVQDEFATPEPTTTSTATQTKSSQETTPKEQ